MQISQNSVSNSGQVLTSPPRFLLTKMHFLFLFSLSSACERVNYSLPVSNLDMNYDSRVRPCCVHLVVASKDNSRKETVRKRLIERLTGFFFSSADCSKGNGTLRIKQEVTTLILS